MGDRDEGSPATKTPHFVISTHRFSGSQASTDLRGLKLTFLKQFLSSALLAFPNNLNLIKEIESLYFLKLRN